MYNNKPFIEANRRSIRLKGYDYSKDGAYFVTICTQNRFSLFGRIIDSEMQLSNAGMMIEKWIKEISFKFENAEPKNYIIMPNHVHLIVFLSNNHPPVGADLRVCPSRKVPGGHAGPPLPRIVQWFKTMTTNEYIRNTKKGIYPPFDKRVWQRNYYEHVIRNEEEYLVLSDYIINNPQNWENDKLFNELNP